MVEKNEQILMELRKKAEEILKQSDRGELHTLYKDMEKLIDELRVHQTELDARFKRYEREIEEQKQIADAIAQYKTIFATTSVGIGITDSNGTLTEYNQAFADMLGYPLAELYGKSIQDFNHPDDSSREETMVYSLTKENTQTRLEKRFLKKDGNILWADLTVSAVFPDEGEPYYVGILIDINESIAGRHTIERLHKRLETALENGNMAWWELELPSGKVLFNERKAGILGYTPEQFSHYSDFMQLVHPEDYEPTMEAFRNHLNGSAQEYSCEYRIRNSQGEYQWFRDLGKISERKNDTITLTGIVTEISEQKRIRRELENANRRFLTILQHINVGILVIVRHTQEIIYANPYIQSFYPEPIEHKLCSQIFGYKDDLCPYCAVFSNSENMENTKGQYTSTEYHLIEIEKWFLLQMSPIRWVDNQDVALMILTDITPMKELDKLKDDINRITHHDLKNPLNGILGGVSILLMDEEGSFTEKQKEYLALIEDSGRRMLTMIDDSLGLYKMEKGIYEVRHEKVNLEELLEKIIKEHQRTIDGKNIQLSFHRGSSTSTTGNAPTARAEQLLCYSLFSNLLKNALEASRENDPVSISIKDDVESLISVSIWNRQVIPEEIRPHFGTKYSTWGKNRGTGLGVYSARLMTETQGGIFYWESSEPAGTSLRVSLPAMKEEKDRKKDK